MAIQDQEKQLSFQFEAPDLINHPPHYTHSIETIDVIESWGLGFHLGNAVKYISRAGRKGNAVEDLLKARWYIDRAITRLESGVK